MCATCGCSDEAGTRVTNLGTGRVVALDADGRGHEHGHSHEHGQGHEHGHSHDHDHGEATRTVAIEQDVLAKNGLLAERNRGWLAGRGILALNLMSSPGAGKTTLLERTIRDVGEELAISVVEGDQETLFDAERIRATGCAVVQVNTGSGCHLDAPMLGQALASLDPATGSTVLIENVGNLVCPALFDLGEAARVVIMSVTEGDDKPLKYPHMFRTASLVVLNKIDLTPYVDFDGERWQAAARQLQPEVEVLPLSATTGEGLDGWYSWLRARHPVPA